jgi:hypothetical protein
MSKHLEITLSAANVKRLDCKEYGVTSREAWVAFELAGKKFESNKVEALTLDPSWDQVCSCYMSHNIDRSLIL